MMASHERNLLIAALAYRLVRDADFDNRYGAYAQLYSVPIRVRYCGRIDLVLTPDRRLDVWYRAWGSRRTTRAAAFILDTNGTASVVSVNRRHMNEWLPLLEERARMSAPSSSGAGMS